LSSSGFIRKYSQEFKKDVGGLSRGVLLALDGYDWPGNVRQLEVPLRRPHGCEEHRAPHRQRLAQRRPSTPTERKGPLLPMGPME
jgi:transcriptional regulator with PAS, ATPase and Fis domain